MQGNYSKRTGALSARAFAALWSLIGAGGSLGRPTGGDGPLRLCLKQ